MARLFARWHRYKYRFVPWIAREFDRQIARNPVSSDRLSAASVFDEDRVKDQLIRLLFALHATACSPPPPPPHAADRNSHTRSPLASPAPRGDTRTQRSATHMSRWQARLFPEANEATAGIARSIAADCLGSFVRCLPSTLGPNAGLGVFAFGKPTPGGRDESSPVVVARPGDLVALYPGTFYSPGEPLFWASLGNKFIFRCADGMLLDGNRSGISASIFHSLLYRDSIPPTNHVAADSSWMGPTPPRLLTIPGWIASVPNWLTSNAPQHRWEGMPDDPPLTTSIPSKRTSLPPLPLNPLAVGQFVNNATVGADAKGADADAKGADADAKGASGRAVGSNEIQSDEIHSNVIRSSPNVSYFEMGLKCPREVQLKHLQYLPYLYYDSSAMASIVNGERDFKVVGLVATKPIHHGDELFSSYFSVVDDDDGRRQR